MARPLRIEFPGATYHVTARGDRRESIFVDDADRASLLDVLSRGLERFDAAALAYCLMGNHYHLVVQTRRANLSRLMRHVNGVYTQRFNRRHDKVGHLFQGRFKAILVDSDAYLLTLCRYVELNPVRAGWVDTPLAWAWSSCRAHVGAAPAPPWLDTLGLHAQLLGRAAKPRATPPAPPEDMPNWWAASRICSCGRERCSSRSTWATTALSAACRHWPARRRPRLWRCRASSDVRRARVNG